MSTISYSRVSPVRSQAAAVMRQLASRLSELVRPIKPYIETAASILFFSAVTLVLLGTKAAVMFTRMHG
jgi:hypothetical protein